jgi:hypothetical protein
MKRLSGQNPRLGQCYVLSYQYVTSNNDCELIHGYITDKQTSRMIDHAWVEIGNEVYDPVLDWKIDKQAYYGLYDAEVDKRYTQKETYSMAAESGTYGPWHVVKPINWWKT